MKYKFEKLEEVNFNDIDHISNVVSKYMKELEEKLFEWFKEDFNYIYTKKPSYKMNYNSENHNTKVTMEYLPTEVKLNTDIPPFNQYELSYEFIPARKILKQNDIDYKKMTYEQFCEAIKFLELTHESN